MRRALRFAASLFFIWVCVGLAHAPLLRLPYYWDEAGYYIPAAYDLFRTGALIPYSTLTNAHPPGLSLLLAAAWRVFGFHPLTTRLSLCLVAALALLAVYRLVIEALPSRAVAFSVALLTACYPVFFSQSTLAHADMPACALTLWALVFTLRRNLVPAVVCFSLAALTKEIAIGTPLALCVWFLWQRRWKHAGLLCLPTLPLAAWFGYHRWRTGFTFGNPQYLRYNGLGTLTPERFLLAGGHRALHLGAHLNLFVPVALALGSLVLPPLRASLAFKRELWIIILANAVLFSLLGGALLTRYLLPEYPLVLLLATSAAYTRFQCWQWFPVVGAGAFAAALLLPTPYRIAPEDTLLYSDAIHLEQDAIAWETKAYPQATVLTAWPVTDGLTRPELGYVNKPHLVTPIENFSLGSLQTLVASPVSYSTAIVFSTKYEPAGLRLPALDRRAEERYFGLHHDLSAGAVAQLLGGAVVWQEQRRGMGAAVLVFPHARLAGLL